MENQSYNGYTDLLQSDVGLDDLHWSGGHEEQHIDLEGHEENHINLEETQEATPPVKASSKKARASKASAPKSGSSKRQKNFTQAEDLTLCDAYLEITQDPIIGVDQSRDCYWKRINAYFHANKTEDSGRTQGSLQHRWAVIQEQVNKFSACYAQVMNRNQSGMTHENKLAQALVKYASDEGNKPFGLMHCFNKLEDTEKWKSRPKIKKHKTSSMDTPGTSSSVFEDEATSPSKSVPTKRPIGQKRAKEAQRQASASGSSSRELFGDIFETRESKRQERFELMLAIDKQREEERLAEERNRTAIKEKKVALEEEKIQIMRMAEERLAAAEDGRIMSMDISGMGEEEKEFYKLRKSQILKRLRNYECIS